MFFERFKKNKKEERFESRNRSAGDFSFDPRESFSDFKKRLDNLSIKEKRRKIREYKEVIKRRYEGLGELRKLFLKHIKEKEEKGENNIDVDFLLSEAEKISGNYFLDWNLVKPELEKIIKNILKRIEDNSMMSVDFVNHILKDKIVRLNPEKVLGVDKKILHTVFKGGAEIKWKDEFKENEFNSLMFHGGPMTFLGSKLYENYSKKSEKHEEQHHIFHLRDRERVVLGSEKIEEALIALKDELLAMYRGGSKIGNYEEYILKFYPQIWKNLKKDDKEKFNLILLKSVRIIYEMNEYFKGDVEKVIGILMEEPIEKWEKVWKRLKK